MSRQAHLQVVVLAILNHLYIRRYEPKRPLWLAAFLLFEPTVFLVVLGSTPLNLRFVLSASIVFWFSLASSIVLYRISPFHPLAKYPGPVICKITQFWNMWVQRSGSHHIANKKLHDKYGPFVRTGPNELSVIDVNAALGILGPGGLPKGRYYESRHDPRAPGNLLVLNGHAHTDRRRLWSRGLSTESLAEYEEALVNRVESLVEKLRSTPDPVDLSKWITFLSLDFMGDMAFGAGFNMLEKGYDEVGVHSLLEEFLSSLAIISHIPWAVPTLLRLPFISRNILKLREFALNHAMVRVKKGATKKDLWYHLSDEPGLEKSPPPVRDVVADSGLVMNAGADTAATGLCNLFYLLLTHPEYLKKVQAELDDVYPLGEDTFSSAKHGELVYLNACINECLRLLPPIPTSGPRQVPAGSGGRTFAEHYIPENTQIYIPPYAMHRNPDYFSPAPDKFVPERWLSDRRGSDQTFNLQAFIPFSHGPANCVGRGLARREIMMVASSVIRNFDLRFADGYDPSSWLRDLQDQFVCRKGSLLVTLSPRE